ncbi:MAG: cytidine deaminase [Halieaceae bacterium]|jgi:cytidine deaminase
MTELQTLASAAKSVRKHAHAPYSGFLVGAALLDEQGNVHLGTNVENAAFPLGSCAEGNAIGAMIASGGKRIVCIVVVGGRDQLESCTPCGGCRQRIAEFADASTDIVMTEESGEFTHFTLAELLPAAFVWPESS